MPGTKLLPQHARWQVLLKLAQQERHLDVLNRAAVDDYVEATGASVLVMPYGADKCARMGRDLAAMHKAKLLVRHASGLQGMSGMGFPRWVWSYRLTDAGRQQLATAA